MMASKPRKPRRSIREQFEEMLADATIDAGEYGTNKNVAGETHKRGRGRPRVYNRADTMLVLQWYLANERLLEPCLPLDVLHKSLQTWLGVDKVPAFKTMEAWFQKLRSSQL